MGPRWAPSTRDPSRPRAAAARRAPSRRWRWGRPPTSELEARVEGVADPVTQEVEAEDREEDRESRERAEPRRLLEIAPRGGQHDPPGRRRRLGAEPEGGQRRLGEE